MIKKAGFTLIELLVAISIIGILSAIGLNAFEDSQGRARDSKRQEDLKSIEKALELYYQDNKAYPDTSSQFWSTCNGSGMVTQAQNAWIPGLTTGGYIRQLPLDPKRGTSASALGHQTGGSQTYTYCYTYRSNRTDYKVLSYCAIEGKGIDNNNNFYRGTVDTCTSGSLNYSYAIYTDGAAGW